MRKIDKLLSVLFVIVIVILTLLSLAALVLIHWKFTSSSYAFSFSPDGMNMYLSAYGEYKALFAGTIAVIAGYYGIHRMTVAAEANLQKIKHDRFSEWKYILEIRSDEIEKIDPFMKKEFYRIRYNLFERLFLLNFNIESKIQLKDIFDNIFKDLVRFFEEQNNKHINSGGLYSNARQSYSFDSFRYLFLGCVDTFYPNIVNDLLDLYLGCLPEDRLVQ